MNSVSSTSSTTIWWRGKKDKVVPVHIDKAYMRSRGIAPLFLNLGTRQSECQRHTCALLHVRTTEQGAGRAHSLSWRLEEEKNLFSLSEFKPWTIKPVSRSLLTTPHRLLLTGNGVQKLPLFRATGVISRSEALVLRVKMDPKFQCAGRRDVSRQHALSPTETARFIKVQYTGQVISNTPETVLCGLHFRSQQGPSWPYSSGAILCLARSSNPTLELVSIKHALFLFCQPTESRIDNDTLFIRDKAPLLQPALFHSAYRLHCPRFPRGTPLSSREPQQFPRVLYVPFCFRLS